MALKMSADGRAKLIQREGSKTRAYKDSVGVWTIGVGHTAAAGPPAPVAGMVISRAEVDAILSRDLVQYERAINQAVHVPLSQGQFDALCSFCFNIGIGGFKGSTVVKRLNNRDYKGAADAFMKWVKPPEIRGRRESERQQFVRATYAQKAQQSGEPLTAADLRKAGSRTMEGASQVKNGAIGAVATVAGSGALEAVSNIAGQASDTVQTAQSVASSVQTVHEATPGVLGWLQAHWPHLLIGANVILALACIYFVWRIWRGAQRVERAKVEDTNDALAALPEEAADAEPSDGEPGEPLDEDAMQGTA